MVERLLFKDWVITTENKSWINETIDDQIKIESKCCIFEIGDASIACEKFVSSVYLSVNFKDIR